MAGAESLAELKYSAKLGKTFPVGRLGGLVGGWLRKAKNKTEAQHSWDLGLAELGKISSIFHDINQWTTMSHNSASYPPGNSRHSVSVVLWPSSYQQCL